MHIFFWLFRWECLFSHFDFGIWSKVLITVTRFERIKLIKNNRIQENYFNPIFKSPLMMHWSQNNDSLKSRLPIHLVTSIWQK
jgi:hypothetical protein